MTRENSFTDSEGRSLTPDLEGEVTPGDSRPTRHPHFEVDGHEHRFDIATLASMRSNRSLRSRILSHKQSTAVYHDPKERFRKVVHHVIAIHRGTTLLNSRTVGAEPGLDPKKPSVDAVYRHMVEECEIEVVDYSTLRSKTRRLNNREFVDLMDESSGGREPWVKARWININGMSWDVIKAVSIKYDLHPLALEDVLQSHSVNRSKAEYYPKHLFLHVVCHELRNNKQPSGGDDDNITGGPRSNSPVPMSDFDPNQQPLEPNGTSKVSGSSKAKLFQRSSLLPMSRGDVNESHPAKQTTLSSRQFTMQSTKEKEMQERQRELKTNVAIVASLKRGSRVNVDVSSMFLFLLRDGTVISIRSTVDLNFTAPISYRLASRDTVLRKSADASLLIYALIDLIVDKAIQVVDQYNIKIQKFERDILLNLKMGTVQELHITSADLALHKRALEPVKALIYSLRRYDDDRSAALIDTTTTKEETAKVAGFMSAKSKIYLAGAYDHMEYVLSSLDTFASITENLISYCFNIKSYEMNTVMQRLTITTIIFLPLTFLAGYFGMNFQEFWSVQNNSDLFFWEIVLPILAAFTCLVFWKELWAMARRLAGRRSMGA